ncbi:ATP-binding protein [Notoacmeibacter marinus]|uniref:ATP-binding protein n=1 Tax=Notoacmeibacter marinus TaxID=1876515 RepID=UPI000DF32FB2|nr:ATP-binding protein [Notoacmeibacter marinus]
MRLYPFIDIAVLPQVRESFSKGEALAVLSEDAAEILWINGPGSAFFGSDAIEDWIGEATPLQAHARRQVRAAGGGPSPRPLLLRMDRSVTQRQVAIKASRIDLPDGSRGILVIAPGTGEEHALSGFSDDKTVAALLNETGARIVGDPRLDEIGPSPEDLLVMRNRLDREGAASVKRRIQTGQGLVPAALGDLGGEPKRFILFMFLEPASNAAPVAAASEDAQPATLRFLWETDSDGRFAIVSEPFKRVVGSTAAVEDRLFQDVMTRLGLDPQSRLSSLMQRQETWSGQTVLWPIAKTSDAVPTDLAALPLFDRERRFLGYRGYGVAHLLQIAPDPERRGMDFGDAWPDQSEPPVATGKDDGVSVESGAGAGTTPVANVLFEPPALTPSLLRRRSDRPDNNRTRKALTDAETLAFQTIGARLREESDPEPEASDAEGIQTETGDAEPDTSFADPRESVQEPDAHALPPDARAAEFVEEESTPDKVSPAGGDETELNDEIARLAIEAMGWQRSNKADPTLIARLAALSDRNPTNDGKPRPADEIADSEAIGGGTSETTAEVGGDSPVDDTQDESGAHPVSIENGVADLVTDEPDASSDLDDAGAEPDRSSVFAQADEADPIGRGPETDKSDETVPDAAIEVKESENAAQLDIEAAAAPLPRSTHLTPSALAFLPVPSLVLDRGRIAYASRALLDLTGYPDVAAMETAGGFAELFGEPETDGNERPDGPPLRIVKANGAIAAIHAQMQAIGWNGASALLFAFTPVGPQPQTDRQDTTDRTNRLTEDQAARRAEEIAEPLRRHVDELSAILDTATDGVIILTPEGDIRSINRSGEALFGDDADALRNRPFRQLFAYESRLTIDSYLASLRESEMASVLNDGREVIGKEKGGGFIPLFITLGKLPFDSGYCVVLRDITPWKRVENELREARRAAEDASAQKTEFLARVSHEVRTPLNAIIGFSELMISERFGPVGNPRYRDYLRDIQKSGTHVLDLVNDLLDISKIEGGHQEMEYEALGLNEVVAEAVAMLQPQANAERVIIRTSMHSGLPDVVADPRSVKQVAINVLTNAVKFTAAGGQVIVSTGRNRDGSVTLRFRDSGIGMSEDDISQALKPFKQISTLRRSRRDGTGLGLPLTKALVEANKARFSIESEPNIGTLIEVTFPSGRVLN